MGMPNDCTDKTRVLSINAHADLMRMAFNQVCDQDDWRGPIDCIVPWEVANIYMDAIRFMTATDPTAERCGGPTGSPSFRLRSIGYRAGPAGA